MKSEILSPVLYIPHGGGPLPLLGDPGHRGLAEFLKNITGKITKPASILVVSAHWEEDVPTITSGSQPELIYDYYGFPDESYDIRYDVSGSPALANKLLELMQSNGVQARLDEQRGFDHGLFVPLKLMYPDAQIPCVQLSLLGSLDPAKHIVLGKSLALIRRENVLIVGSGMSFHNLRAFFSPRPGSGTESEAFDQWLIETCTGVELAPAEREQRLTGWEKAPHARFCHPREEHLLPLHVCYGAASVESPIAEVIFNQDLMGRRVTGLLWS